MHTCNQASTADPGECQALLCLLERVLRFLQTVVAAYKLPTRPGRVMPCAACHREKAAHAYLQPD